MFGDNFTVDECDDADCLHPCYGASHERYCNQCWLIAYGKIQEDKEFIFDEQETKLCRACKIPSPEAQELPMYTYDQYVDLLKAKSAEAEAQGQ